MDGAFALLTNVVWTNAGPCAVDDFEETRARLQAAGQRVTVYGVDKFPRMVDYVVPPGVRIADGDRVRLGAHLADGTTVMHEGFVNFNAGTLGTLDGRGPHLGRRRGRQGLRRGWRRLDHGHAVRRRQGGHLDRRALPAGRQRRRRHLARRRLRRRGGLLRHRRHQGHPARRPRRQGRWSCRAPTTCCSAATRSRARSRPSRGRPAGSSSTPSCTPTDVRRPASHRSAHDPSSRRAAGRHRAGVRRRCRLPHVARRVAAVADPAGRGVPGARGGPPGRAGPGAVALRRPDHRDLGAARDAGPGRHDRARHGVPGVRPAQPRVRRPRLARPVPAAPVAGVGVARRSSSTRTSPPTPSTTPWRRSTAT